MMRKSSFKRVVIVMGVVVLLGCAFLVRMDTFWLSHWIGDQLHYLVLAQKLDIWGPDIWKFDCYNLKGVEIRLMPLDKENRVYIAFPRVTLNPSEKGDVLLGLERAGIYYYDQPFFHKPPAFPYALMISHRLFATRNQPYSVIFIKGMPSEVLRFRIFFGTQFWAAIVPLAFSVGTVLFTFVLGWILFSYRVGIYAALMMALNPVSIMTSQRIWADDMVAFFVTVAMVFFVWAFARKSAFLSFLAGISCGVAVLAKQTGGYLCIAVWIFSVMSHQNRLTDIKALPRIVFNKYFVSFFAAVMLISGFWFLKIYRIYGNPLWLPGQSGMLDADKSGWFGLMYALPPGWILHFVGGIYLCPFFILAFTSVRRLMTDSFQLITKQDRKCRFVFLWLVVLTFYYMSRSGQEYRHMLPAYPAWAVLSAYYLDRLRQRIAQGRVGVLSHVFVQEGIVLALFLIYGLWSVPLGISIGIQNQTLMRVPFLPNM